MKKLEVDFPILAAFAVAAGGVALTEVDLAINRGIERFVGKGSVDSVKLAATGALMGSLVGRSLRERVFGAAVGGTLALVGRNIIDNLPPATDWQ